MPAFPNVRTWLVAGLVALLALPAWAQGADDEKKKPKTGVSGVLVMLDWLASDAEVLAELKRRLDDEYREKMKLVRDTFKIDRLMREKREKLKEIKKTLVRFDGQRTGYETSLIAQDYLPNDGESVLKVEDKSAQRFYFFKHGRLWKIVVAYHTNVTQAMSFAAFVGQVAKKYGKPASKQTGEVDGKKQLVAAVWEDDLTQLTVENRTGFFGTYVMKFIAKSEGLAYEAERADRKEVVPTTAGDSTADALMADIAGGPTGDVGENVVDQLTGVEHTFDVNAGRTYNKPLVRAGDTGAPRVRNIQEPSIDNALSADPAPAKAAKPTKKRTARGDAAKELDSTPVPSTGSDVIIY